MELPLSRRESAARASRWPVLPLLFLGGLFLMSPALIGSDAAAQSQRPRFETTVEIVQLQVQVRDADGVPVVGLSGEDFELRIDGESRDVVAAYEVDLRPERVGQDPAPLPPAGWRQFLIFFDFSFTSPRGVLRAREAVLEFLDNDVSPRDLIGVATYNRLSGIQLLTPFTADLRQVRATVASLGLGEATRIIDPAGFVVEPMLEGIGAEADATTTAGPDANILREQNLLETLRFAAIDTAASDFRRYRAAVIDYADQLGALGEMLRAARGRKHLLMFSQGFDDKVLSGQSLEELAEDAEAAMSGRMWEVNSETRFGSIELRNRLDAALEQMRAADVVVHAFDTSGLGGTADDDTFLSRGTGRDTLNYLSNETAGTVAWNVNDLAPTLGRLARETSQYYVLAYRKSPDDPPTVELDVGVRAPGAEVTSAPTLLAPPPAYGESNANQRQLQLAEFVTKGVRQEEAMTMESFAFAFPGDATRNRVAVLTEVPWQQLERLARQREAEVVEFDVLGYLLSPEGRMLDAFSRRVQLDVARMRAHDDVAFRYYDLLWAPSGEFTVRVLLREAELGRLTTRDVPISVPSYGDGELGVSGPVFVDAARPGLLMRGFDSESPPPHKAGRDGPLEYPFVVGDTEVTPQVFTVMEAGETCYLMVVAHNLARHPFTGRVHARVRAATVDEAGSSHAVEEIRIVDGADARGGASRSLLLEARLPTELGPGPYLLQVDVSDGIRRDEIGRTLPFFIEPASTTER